MRILGLILALLMLPVAVLGQDSEAHTCHPCGR